MKKDMFEEVEWNV